MRLSPDTLAKIPGEVARPSYDRDAQQVGIVHFGLGAFARAHLAAHTDAAMNAGERDWMIAGVSLRSASVADQLNPQGGLFTVTEESGTGSSIRVIGSIREVMVAAADRERIVAAIASPKCRIVSFTVTEKGYCRAADGGLDLQAAEASFYPLLAEGLERRRQARLPGVTLLSCDNLSDNGGQLCALLGEYLTGELEHWFAANCTTPNAMVDRIVPATSPDDLDACAAALGLRDEACVFTEAFRQWVIEDDFAGPRPRWEEHGAQIVADVAPYETAKLRMLNGAHSLLAYAGLARGHAFVHQAMADRWLRERVESIMRDEAAPTIAVAPGQNLSAYADELLQRFENPALDHRLTQIAMDGSQKIPQRWLDTLAQSDRACPAILTGIAAWLLHIDDGSLLDDPVADQLRSSVAGQSVAKQVEVLFGPGGLLASAWMPTSQDVEFIERASAELASQGGT